MRRLPILGMVLALLGGLLLGGILLRSDSPPDLTQARLEAAQRLWEESGPSSYTIEVQMAGALSDLRRVEVLDGRVTDMTVEGRPVAESAWEYWSVEGMLGFLQTELRNRDDPPASLGVTDPSQIVLRARFDEQLGYPTYFFRHILGRQQSTEWDVVSFTTP